MAHPGISPASLADAEALLELMEQFYAEERYPYDYVRARSALLPLLEDASIGRVFIARDPDQRRSVGYVVLTLGWSLEYQGRDAFVDELFVSPSHRGRGLAKALLRALESACRELSVEALHLEVERENHSARELYRKWGFRDKGRLLLTKRFDSEATPPSSDPEGAS